MSLNELELSPMNPENLEARIAALERRVTCLERIVEMSLSLIHI